MDKKILIGGGAIAGITIVSAIIIGLSVYSAQKSRDNDYIGESSQTIKEQEKNEIEFPDEIILKNKIEELLKKQFFYKGTVAINEKQSWKSRGTDGSSGIGDAKLISEEILVYDEITDKSYIVGRYLSYNSQHTVTVNDMSGKYIGTSNVSAKGELIEYYGAGILKRAVINDGIASTNFQYVLDFGMNPLRMDHEQKLIYTNPKPNKEEWVTYISTADTTRLGSARIFTPESRVNELLNLVPGLSNIDDSRGYNKDETYVFEATDRFFIPVGTFSYNYQKITYEEAMEEIFDIKDDVEFEKAYEELAKNQPPAWKETAKLADDMGAIATGAQRIWTNVEYSISVTDKTIIKESLNTISENQILQENLKQLKENIEAVVADQGSPRMLNGVVIETSNDQKGGSEQKILKKGLDAFLPLLNVLFLEYDTCQKSLQKNIEEARSYLKVKDNLPEDKVILLFKDFLKNTQSLKKANSYINAMLADIQIILTDLNGVKNADNETRFRELNNLYGLWEQTLNKYKTGQDVSIKVDIEKGVSLHKDYPKDVVKIIDGAIVAVSEVIKEEGMTKNGFAVTLKTNLSTDDALQFYKNYLKNVPDLNVFNVAGIATLSGNKGGYEFSIMIMKNSLGGIEKTMIQIMLTPL